MILSMARTLAIPDRGLQRGMTLIEVLVTLLLVSVGLLGVAALQLASLKNNQEAYVRSQASVLAGDILDRIRANANAFRDGEYTVDYNEEGATGSRAGDDITAWQAAIDATLPGGEENAAGKIERDGNIVTITIRWSERTTQQFSKGADDDDDASLPTFETRSEI